MMIIEILMLETNILGHFLTLYIEVAAFWLDPIQITYSLTMFKSGERDRGKYKLGYLEVKLHVLDKFNLIYLIKKRVFVIKAFVIKSETLGIFDCLKDRFK